MPSTKPVWGIDVGQCALKALCLRKVGDAIEIVDHAYIEHSRLLCHPDADRPALIKETVDKLLAEHDLEGETIVVGVPGKHTLSRFSKLPPVDKKKIPQIVDYEAQQQIPFDMEEVIWDYQVFHDEAETETEVGIFAMRRDLLREHLQFLLTRNIEPSSVQPSPLALVNALRYDGITSGDEAVCVLDIGTQNTDLIVVDGNSLWTRNIPLGGNNFTEVLLKTFKLSFSRAERLKREAEKHKHARQIFQAMRPVFADLVAEIQRSIGFFTSSRRGVKLRKIIAMGNAFQLPGLVKFVQQHLGMDVVRPNSFSKLPVTDAPNAPKLIDHLMSFGVAYGLALQGLGEARIDSSLLPPEIAKQVVWRKKTPWFYGAAACLVLSAVIVWGRNIIDSGTVAQASESRTPPRFSPVYAEGDPAQKEPRLDERAESVIRGSFSGVTAMDKAKEVLAVSQHLRDVLQTIESRNEDRIAQAKKVAELRESKRTWPAILQLVHDALPAPDQALSAALAQGPAALRDLIASNPDRYERKNRGSIWIRELRPVYSEDVLSLYRTLRGDPEPSSGAGYGGGYGGGSGVGSDYGPGGQTPGFLIMMRVQTPNQSGYQYLEDAYLQKLRGASSGKGVYLAHARALRYGQIKDGGAERTGGSFKGSGSLGGRSDLGLTSVETIDDPVTGESRREDYEFEVVVVAVLGQQPEEPSETGATDNF